MVRKSRIPFKLDIVGLNPRTFQAHMRSVAELVESRSKGTSSRTGQTSEVSDSQVDLYNRIASIAIDFERAYGRSVEIKVFERSANKLFETLLKFKGSRNSIEPELFVNGVRIYKGVPNSFSELDEAIERAFGRS